jgi:hypothetical protein
LAGSEALAKLRIVHHCLARKIVNPKENSAQFHNQIPDNFKTSFSQLGANAGLHRLRLQANCRVDGAASK